MDLAAAPLASPNWNDARTAAVVSVRGKCAAFYSRSLSVIVTGVFRRNVTRGSEGSFAAFPRVAITVPAPALSGSPATGAKTATSGDSSVVTGDKSVHR